MRVSRSATLNVWLSLSLDVVKQTKLHCPRLRQVVSTACASASRCGLCTRIHRWVESLGGERRRDARVDGGGFSAPASAARSLDGNRGRDARYLQIRVVQPAYLSSKSSSFADVALSTTMLRLATPLLLLATAHGALELTEDNWNSALAGKSAFVKFLAPW